MKHPLAYYGNPILRKKAAAIPKITDELKQLVADMIETMTAHNGCGLAAPQIHQSIALFITRIDHHDEEDNLIPGEVRVFINPKIISHTPEQWTCSEGCLSIPGVREDVSRPEKVVIQATNLDGVSFEEEFTEFDAHVIMHENDHLNGVLFIDRLSPKKKKEIEPKLRLIKKKHAE